MNKYTYDDLIIIMEVLSLEDKNYEYIDTRSEEVLLRQMLQDIDNFTDDINYL